ncbi:MAG: hypothetical protein K6T65_01570 [Peptococcaceae bacterium]|nr:hypothetical protein [Peptococcaceae bacterium]
MMKYWLIYTHRNRLELHQAIGFDDLKEMKEWYEERKENIKIIDVAKSLDEEE